MLHQIPWVWFLGPGANYYTSLCSTSQQQNGVDDVFARIKWKIVYKVLNWIFGIH